MKKIRVWTVVRIVWIIAGISFTTWLFMSSQARGVKDTVIESDSSVLVSQTSQYISFVPRLEKANVGLILYPGAMIEPVAYAPIARALAEQGFTSVIMMLPFRMAPLKSHEVELFKRTIQYMSEDSQIAHWYIGGHSRGGAISARFVKENSSKIEGLILIATTHPKDFDLSHLSTAVTKVYASEDGLASTSEIERNAKYLPSNTNWVKIDGGNHAQFGWYGSQLGDGKALISREEQQEQLVKALINALSQTG